MTALAEHHRQKLYGSALTDETIDRMGFRTETDPREITRILNWRRPAKNLGPCLVLPYHHADGTRNGFARVRPDRPRTGGGKYEQPAGASGRAYFCPGAVDAIRTPRAPVGITEGEFKALSADQSGCPCIGLAGVWNWQAKREKDGDGHGKGERLLIPDLAGIDWRGRPVWIGFDTDESRKPAVNQARAELARVLTDHGARVVFVDLPHGPRGPDGLPGKMGCDDYIFAHGPDAFRELIGRSLEADPKPRDLADWRAEMAASRVASIGNPGVYLDTSPPGAGKSYSDLTAARRAGTSLVLLPAHVNCRELAELFQSGGLVAEAYPELSAETCANYEQASRAIGAGLAASSAICPGCIYQRRCDYQDALADADAAAHRIATHARGVFALEYLAAGRRFVAIHEDALGVIRPTAESAAVAAFGDVLTVADTAGHRAAERGDEAQRHFLWRLGEVAQRIGERLTDANDTSPIDLPAPVDPPRGVDAALFGAMQSANTWPSPDAMRICKGAAAGELAELVVRVDRIFRPGGKADAKRSVVGVWRRSLPERAAVWLSDATADRAELESVVGPVIDATPGGRIEQRHPALQVPIDVKRGSSAGRVAAVARALLESWPEFERVGIIIDRRHVPVIDGTARRGESLGQAYRDRIARVEHFRSGQSRGSNEWLVDCDAIAIIGTPRVPPSAVRARLIQTGNHLAAARDGRWEADWWSGVDAAGRRHTIRTAAYRDHDWHRAHLAIVRAELLQAVGRGRGILAEGLPVIVATNEDLGLPLAMVDARPLTDAESEVLAAVRELSGHDPKGARSTDLSGDNSKIYLLELSPVSSASVASALERDERWTRRLLNSLHERGLIERIGQRGGWLPTAPRPSE